MAHLSVSDSFWTMNTTSSSTWFVPRCQALSNDQQLAGAKSPRASSGPAQNSEPYGEEAKYFVECRLLQRPIKVQLLSAPVSLGAIPFATAAPGVLPAPQPAGSGVVIGTA